MGWYKGILHTAGKTIEEIKAAEPNWEYTDEQAKIIQEYMEAWDGIHAMFMDDGSGRYSIIGWPPEEDEKVATAIYLMEQDPVFGTYQNNRAQFDQDWEDGTWEPSGAIGFQKETIEITESHEKTVKQTIKDCFLIERGAGTELGRPKRQHGKCLGYRMKEDGSPFFECQLCKAFIDFKY